MIIVHHVTCQMLYSADQLIMMSPLMDTQRKDSHDIRYYMGIDFQTNNLKP